jgi:hypothetical protein
MQGGYSSVAVISTHWRHGFLGLVAFVIPLPECAPDQSVMCCSLARNVLLNKAWKGRQAQIMSSAFNVCDAKGADLARRAHFLPVGR